jgi:hypothetical protein
MLCITRAMSSRRSCIFPCVGSQKWSVLESPHIRISGAKLQNVSDRGISSSGIGVFWKACWCMPRRSFFQMGGTFFDDRKIFLNIRVLCMPLINPTTKKRSSNCVWHIAKRAFWERTLTDELSLFALFYVTVARVVTNVASGSRCYFVASEVQSACCCTAATFIFVATFDELQPRCCGWICYTHRLVSSKLNWIWTKLLAHKLRRYMCCGYNRYPQN